MNRNLSAIREEAKKAIKEVEVVNALAKTAKVEKDVALAQKKIDKAKIVELEIATSIEIGKLKAELVNLNKVEEIKEEKHKLEEELVGAKDKAIKEYQSSKQFMDDLVEELLEVFFQGFEYCKKKVKDLFSLSRALVP